MNKELVDIYGNKIRVRVAGILKHENRFLMVNHKGLNSDNIFWNFPGGGVEKKESIESALIREFKEETYLKVQIKNLLYINEHIVSPLHAIEFYFKVITDNYDAKLGLDPELNIISDFKWFSINEILNLPENHKPSFLSENLHYLEEDYADGPIHIFKK